MIASIKTSPIANGAIAVALDQDPALPASTLVIVRANIRGSLRELDRRVVPPPAGVGRRFVGAFCAPGASGYEVETDQGGAVLLQASAVPFGSPSSWAAFSGDTLPPTLAGSTEINAAPGPAGAFCVALDQADASLAPVGVVVLAKFADGEFVEVGRKLLAPPAGGSGQGRRIVAYGQIPGALGYGVEVFSSDPVTPSIQLAPRDAGNLLSSVPLFWGPVLGKIGGASILWKPSGGGDAATWAEVMALVESTPCPLTIWILSSETYSIPARAAFYNLKGASFQSQLGIPAVVDIEDGATLFDCAGGEGAGVFVGHATSPARPTFQFSAFLPPLLGTGAPAIFLSQFGGAYLRQLGTAPMIVVPDNAFMVFAQRYGGGVEQGSTPGQEVIRVGANCTLLTTMIGQPTQFFLNSITGPASANIVVQNDGSGVEPPPGALPNFFGNLFNVPFGHAGGAGPTSFRPAGVFGPLLDGVSYWDTTIQKALWWDSSALVWRDAQGVIVP